MTYIDLLKKDRKLTWGDCVYLFIFLSICIAYLVIPYLSIGNNHMVSFEFVITFLVFILINTTGFANRFTNLTFSVIWIVLSVLYIFFSLSKIILYGSVPLLEFILFQILRFIFWKKYHEEFIPASIYHNKVEDYYNETEGRINDDRDKKFMKILQWVGFVIFMACLTWLVNKP